MAKLSGHRLGLTLGLFMALVHAVLAILVALGIAEPLLKWSLGMHFLSLEVSFQTFSLGPAVVLIIIAFIVGYVFGQILAALWNWIGEK